VGRLGFCLTTKVSFSFLHRAMRTERMGLKDASNSHFTLFEFKKKAKKAVGPKEWKKVPEQGDVLKPCEYKRR
jgi:hypothetical protein